MIYLDHAAATPVSAKALDAMLPYFTEQFFNPSAPYLPAKHVRTAYEAAKNELAHVIGAKGVDLVMTAGATESINLAFTVLEQFPSAKCLTLTTEHTAVLEAAKPHPHDLVAVDKNGFVDLNDLRQKLTEDVVLISVSLANNELGTIQPLAEIAEILRQVRQARLEQGITLPLYLHSDASQALNLMDINVARLGVDLLTLNAAKCGGPKGVGALYVAHGVKLQPVSRGGGQERGLRSGTENVPGVVGFAQAATEAKAHLASARKQYQKMADIIRQELTATKIPVSDVGLTPHTSIIAQDTEKVNTSPSGVRFLGQTRHQLANFIPVCFPGIDAERLIYRLERRGVLVSTGAACAANKGTKSHVLAAIGLSDEEITGSLRISLGSTNTLENVRTAAKIIAEEVTHEYARIAARSNGLGFSESWSSDSQASAGRDQRAQRVGPESATFDEEKPQSIAGGLERIHE